MSSFSPLRLFLPQNLLPFVATLALLLTIAPLTFAQTDEKSTPAISPHDAYTSGDFATAEKAWSESLAKNPTDAIARYNLSLALAQQDRWAEAVAHATASFVQKPLDSPARWQLVLTGEKAGFLPSPIVKFLPAGPLQSLAALAAPGTWQIILIAAAVVLVGALGILLFGMYHVRSRLRTWSAFSLLGIGVVLALSAVVSLKAYGISADHRAVIAWRSGLLRSIPTEADTTQKTTALAAGTAAIEDKTFLGWVHLTFDNGQTGWVRKGDVIALWR